MTVTKRTNATPAAARKSTPRTSSRKLKLVTPAAKAPNAETPAPAAVPKGAQAEPKPANPYTLRLTGKEMRSGVYALQCGDKYLPADFDHKNLTADLAEAHRDDNWATLKSLGRRLSRVLYPGVLPAPFTPTKMIFTRNGLVTTTKPFVDDPWSDVERRRWNDSQLHNMALAQAAEFEDRHFQELSEHSFKLVDSAMWPHLMVEYEEDLKAELAEDDPEAKGDAMRWLAIRMFVAGKFYGAREVQDKREDEAEELRMKRARRKVDERLRKADVEAFRRAIRD